MYLVSKLYWLLLQPLSLAFVLGLAGLVAGHFHWRLTQLATGGASALILFLTLFTTTGALVMQTLEDRFPKPALTAPPACAVVLGGGFETEVNSVRKGYSTNDAGERFIEMIRLAHAYPGLPIIVSGGDGRYKAVLENDGVMAERMFDDFGLDRSNLKIEPISRNTYENAVNSAAIIRKEKLGTCLLITSAFHMPRAVGMFRMAGIDIIPWPVDYRTTGDTGFGLDLTQPIVNANQMTMGIREWSGLIGNYLAGRTGTLFPAP